MPFKPNSNQKYAPAEFFEYFRKNINSFVNPDFSQFFPIVEPAYGINEFNLWNSNNPSNGGLASKITPVMYRPAYTKIRNYLKGNATIQSLECN